MVEVVPLHQHRLRFHQLIRSLFSQLLQPNLDIHLVGGVTEQIRINLMRDTT
jgi:hypothetical protein